MADIKQAAKWMKQRKNVRRAGWETGAYIYTEICNSIVLFEWENEDATENSWFTIADLLADDWEVFNE